jgi:PII-like signaling protein
MSKTFSTISALKVYMKSGDNKKAAHWWKRAFEKPLSSYLVREALRAGIPHASVNLGHMGYAANAKNVSIDYGEIPLTTMPVCIELLAPKRLLEQFVREQAKHLQGTTLVMMDGVHISDLHLSAVDEALEHKPHSVEYITGGDVSVKVDHVQADEAPADEAVG